MKSAATALLLLAINFTVDAADLVVPVDSVKEHVNVRMEADAKSEIVGKLSQGASLPFQRSVPGWHEVALEDDAYGYVSEDWAVVLTDVEFAAREAEATDDVVEEEAVVAVVEEAESEVPVEDAESDVEATESEEIPEVAEEAVEQDNTTTETVSDAVESEAVTSDDVLVEEVAAELDASSEDSEPLEETVAEITADEEIEVVAEVAEEQPAPETVETEAEVPPTETTTTVAVVPVISSPGKTGAQGPTGPVGPPGPPGPTGASGSSTIKGTEDFLMKFTRKTSGGNSQIFDDGNNVGIGTTEPSQRLEVNGNIQIHERNSSVAGLMLTQSSGGMGYIMHNRADTLTLGAGSVDRLTIDRDGNVGIGTVRPTHPLEMANGAYVSAGGVWTNSSSRERKDNIVALTPEEALAALIALEPVRFNYKRDTSEEYVGFIAEDVPGLVASTDRMSLSTMDIVAVLTKVVQQQQQKIEELEARLDNETQD